MNNEKNTSINYNLSTGELSAILQILAIEKQNNMAVKKHTQQEIVNKILGIIRKEVEHEIQENNAK